MSRIPNFSRWSLRPSGASGPLPQGDPVPLPEGIALRPAYGEADRAGTPPLGRPGLAPFLRGPYPTMYVNQPWTIRQYAGFSTAEDSNAFYRRNLAAGQKEIGRASCRERVYLCV